MQKLPSPALKEAERSGSYNPGDLNTVTGGTIRHGTVQGHIAGRATRIYADLKGYAQGKQGVFETLTLGTGGCRGGTSCLDPTDHRDRTRNDGISRP